MCRRLIIEFEWDDSEVDEGYPGVFDPATDYMTLTDCSENVLVKELTGMFDGQITFTVERMNEPTEKSH